MPAPAVVSDPAEQMLALHRRRTATRTPHEQTTLQDQIDAADRQIDRLNYELSGVTEEEIRIGKTS
jgi:hypothetical protein